MQSHLPEFGVLVPQLLTILLDFVEGLGMNLKFLKVPWDFFNIAIIGNGVPSIVVLLLSSHQATFICIQVSSHCRRRLLESKLPDDDFLSILKSVMRSFLLYLAISLLILVLISFFQLHFPRLYI